MSKREYAAVSLRDYTQRKKNKNCTRQQQSRKKPKKPISSLCSARAVAIYHLRRLLLSHRLTAPSILRTPKQVFQDCPPKCGQRNIFRLQGRMSALEHCLVYLQENLDLKQQALCWEEMFRRGDSVCGGTSEGPASPT